LEFLTDLLSPARPGTLQERELIVLKPDCLL